MHKRIIAVLAALAMLYGTTLIKAEGTDERTEVSADQGRADGEGHEEVPGAGGTDHPGRIAPVRITETDTDKTGEGGEVNDPSGNEGTTGDAESGMEGSSQADAGGVFTAVGALGGGDYEPEPVAEGDCEASGDDSEVYAGDSGEDVTVEECSEVGMEYLGDWTISFYCNCPECCGVWSGGATASGVMPSAWWTAATGDLPFGTILYVDGLGTFEVQDRGTSYGWLDVFVSDHSEALTNGLQTRSVYIVR